MCIWDLTLKICCSICFKTFSVEPYNIGLIPLSTWVFNHERPNILQGPALLFLLPSGLLKTSTAVHFYWIWILGWDCKFPQFALKQWMNSQSKQTKTKVSLFHNCILHSDKYNLSCSYLESKLLQLVQFSVQVHKVHSHGGVSKLSC